MPKKGTIPSPCVSRCAQHPAFPWCATCRRTPDEIRRWEQLDDPARRKALERGAMRRRQEEAAEARERP
jgi:predicted Fe-S protein YdhL (DUF1289 family)